MHLLKDKYFYITILVCALISGIVFGYYMAVSGGVFTLFGDYNLQQIPFACVVNDTIKSGSQWSWSTDLGTSLIGGYSFYNLGSPFFWLTLFFHSSAYPYLMGWLFILKYVVAGAAAYVYACCFLNDRKWGVFVGILYAFSGFQSFNIMFFHFHDVVALFPLILIGLEEYIRNNKKSLFIFAIFINAITNYFFFVGEVVFVALYYVARCLEIDSKESFIEFVKKGISCVLYAAAGVGMAAVILVPSVLFILGNSRASAGMPGLFYDRNQFLTILRAFVWPIDVQDNHATISAGEWNSISLYLPLWGISLVIAYVIRRIREKDRLALFTVGLVLMSFIPILNSLFYGLTESTYKRWWYMLTLMLALMSAKVLDDRNEYKIEVSIGINAVLTAGLFVVLYIFQLILRPEIVVLNIVIITLELIVGYLLSKESILNKKRGYECIIIATSVFAFVTTFCTVRMYRGGNDSQSYMNTFSFGTKLEEQDPQYRYNTSFNMFGLVGNVGNMGTFSSTVSNSIAEFHGNLGQYRENASPATLEHENMSLLFGGKYDIVGSADGYKVVERDDVSPIGYSVNGYITEDELREFASVNGYDAGLKLLLKNVAIKNVDLEKYALESVVVHDTNIDDILSSEASELVATNQNNKVNDFIRTKNGFECTTDYDSNSAVYFTIPYDTGWTARVNGIKSDIINSNGMMLVILPAGTNTIKFTYMTPGLIAGCIISIIAFGIFVILILGERNRKTKNAI